MNELRARGWAGAGIAADVLYFSSKELFEARRHEGPGAHVLGLFLDPDPLARGLVARQRAAQEVDRPGIELLDADDCNVALTAHFGAAGGQVVVNLAGAEQDTACAFR